IAAFIAKEFPQTKVQILAAGGMAAKVTHDVGIDELRPGGTVAGPVMMATADVALYVAILAELGIVPMCVTTSLAFNFMRRPPGDRRIVGDCRLLKLGRTLAVGEVTLYAEGLPDAVAHAVGTYSIPPKR